MDDGKDHPTSIAVVPTASVEGSDSRQVVLRSGETKGQEHNIVSFTDTQDASLQPRAAKSKDKTIDTAAERSTDNRQDEKPSSLTTTERLAEDDTEKVTADAIESTARSSSKRSVKTVGLSTFPNYARGETSESAKYAANVPKQSLIQIQSAATNGETLETKLKTESFPSDLTTGFLAPKESPARYPKRSREQSLTKNATEKGKNTAAKKKKKQVEAAAGNNTPPPGPPPDTNVGRFVEQCKLLGTLSGQYYPLNGQIVEYRPAEGRIPPRYAIHWEPPISDEQTADCILEDEWVSEDLLAFDEDVARGSAPITTFSAHKSASYSHHPPPLKITLDNVRQRYQQVVVHDLEESQIVSTLIMVAALEEALQTYLQRQQESEAAGASAFTTATRKTSASSKHHPPLYYSANPSSYLQPPSVDSGSSSPSFDHPKAQITPVVLAQRLRQGCQWAWTYIQSKQRPTPLLMAPVSKRCAEGLGASVDNPVDSVAVSAVSPLDDGTSVAQRRSIRSTRLAPTLHTDEQSNGRTRNLNSVPGFEEPNPVQRGGRVAMWWLNTLEKKAKDKPQSERKEHEKEESAVAKHYATKGSPNNRATVEPTNAIQSFDAAEASEASRNENDDDYSGVDGEQEEDESLQGVEKERTTLSPVPDRKPHSDGVDDLEKEEEEEENEDHAIVWDNPYLRSSFPAFLEYLARSKSISLEEVQKAMDKVTVKIRHNKRTVDNGIKISDLVPSDLVIVNLEVSDYPSNGKVVLKCVSGETAGELQRLDSTTFGRCKFELEVIGEEEKAIQSKRKEDILQQEVDFKERKAWDRWRYKGIHEGYAVWPSWEDSALAWVEQNGSKEDSVAVAPGVQTGDDTKHDEALAKSLEENGDDIGGRRRTARRSAASATEGVFYGNQSQLTQKQLMDALLRVVRASSFQTLMKLQALVTDGSSDPIRRCRIALGKMVWKRNLLARKAVTTQIGDKTIERELALGNPLINVKNVEGKIGEQGHSVLEDFRKYLASLHQTEIKLRSLVLNHLAQVPVPVIATAADERIGSLENLDESDFEDPSNVEWKKTGNRLLETLIFRPPTASTLGTETTECNWYKIKDFSESIEAEADDAEENAMERRKRFRAVPVEDPDSCSEYDGDILILTEAQVHAGAKAAEMQRKHNPSNSLISNPYARITGDRITLVPIDDDVNETKTVPAEIRGRIVAHGSFVETDDCGVEHRVMILPDSVEAMDSQNCAFWAILDVRADDSSFMCQPQGQSTWYSIETQDFHQDSEAYGECERILNWLCSQSKAAPFMKPVDPVALGIPSYPQIVKHPMDISTITDKLENGRYSSLPSGQSHGHSPASRMLNGPFKKDIEAMFDNAILFNPPDDWIHQAAVSLKKSTLKKIENAASSAERTFRSAGGRQRRSIYVYDDEEQNEYESDNDAEYSGSTRRKRKRDNRSSAKKDEAATRPMEHPIRLHNCLKDGNDLRGPFANFPVNTDGGTFSLPSGWGCRKRVAKGASINDSSEELESAENAAADGGDLKKQEVARELADLLALQKALGENETSSLRRSNRVHHPSEERSTKSKSSSLDDLEYFSENPSLVEMGVASLPTSRSEIEKLQEERHEEHYSKLFMEFEKELDPVGPYGVYANGSFPPYLGHVSPAKNKMSMLWEIRSAFAVPALRWVIRGLIRSGHLTAVEPMVMNDNTSGVVIKNDIYYWDPTLQPYDVLDVRGLQRRKRADNIEEESEDDFELSEYEKLRAERVARNADRLRSLGLA